jgi:hypothetical protein
MFYSIVRLDFWQGGKSNKMRESLKAESNLQGDKNLRFDSIEASRNCKGNGKKVEN